jgi:predicted permease
MIATALRSGGRSGMQGRTQHRAQDVLVVGQVALALVLLVSAVLMIRSFAALQTVEPGFTSPATIQTARIAIPPTLEPDANKVFAIQRAILDAVRQIPSVSSVGLSTAVPMDGTYGMWDSIAVEDRSREENAATANVMRSYRFVLPGLFRTTGARIVAGRELDWADIDADRPVALVSENLARELWGSAEAALGKRIRGGPPPFRWRDVIGVVQDTHDNGIDASAPTVAYFPEYMQEPQRPASVQRNVVLAMRSPLAGTESFVRQVEQAVWSVNRSLPLANVTTMQTYYDRSLARTSFTLVMLGIAGAAALVLGVVGLYGVISYAVSQRRREIAIRLALGAQQARVTRAFVRYGAGLAAAGVAIGLVVAAGVTRLMGALLYDVGTLDPLTYAVVALALTAAAALASWVPARRAAAVDPAEALAGE